MIVSQATQPFSCASTLIQKFSRGIAIEMGREPNTDYEVKLLQYKQRKEADYIRYIEQENLQRSKDSFSMKFEKHSQKRRFHSEIEKRLNAKMRDYEDAIDKRREKLRELYAEEERDYIRETIDCAQRGGESQMEEMKRRSQEIIAKRENERLQLVKEKRLQQYMQRCGDLRTAMSKKNTIESKYGQLQQIRENEAKREAERELDHLWHQLTIKDIEAKREREVQEVIDRYRRDKNNKEVWDIQVHGKELLREEMERIALEDRVELEKLAEEMKREEIEKLIEKRKKREAFAQEIKGQIEQHENFVGQRKKEENALDNAFNTLVRMEIEKEKAARADYSATAKREMAMYRENVAELEKQRIEDDRQLNMLLEEYTRNIQRKQDEAKCRIEAAKRQLHKEVMQGIADQIKYKKMIAEEELKMKRDDNELARYAYEVNGRLAVEMAQQEKMARLQYKDDLLKQIDYKKVLHQREKEEIERQLEAGRKEEEKYQKLIEEMCSGKIEEKGKHPFRRVIEQYDCHCPATTK
ncbi:cilia- and flagella-associated protein 53-like isoform X2 [Photinus pyralis]|uniref:cilia- and flagella-associated protein 53-like isoform X2 n=1 Tax=Photinus pyralis TaxID=7054 RepID=UPI00126711E9|nr:cilia- and flagella-associated protein 53-like isoform X2 [Photinus pyralis]